MSRERSVGDEHDAPVRLDKWLWAARFFKTRALAKTAVEAGHVRYQGEHCKVSRIVAVGATLLIRQGRDDVEVVVRALSDVRRGAPEARLLYQETPASTQKRADSALARKANAVQLPAERPSKKDRRLIEKFKKAFVDDWT